MSDTKITFTGAYTCTHHTDQQRAACPVCLVTALTAERDELRDDRANEIAWAKWASRHLADAIAVEAERDQLRAEVETERNLHAQTRTVVEELNTICTDLKNAGGPPFIRSEAIRLLREDQAKLRAEVERVRSDRDCEKRLRKDAEELREDAIARAEKAEAELAAEREKVRVLREALENLCDEQNGAPLETRRDEWQLAMDEARAAIVATANAK
jgi:uncharacterized membrane protein